MARARWRPSTSATRTGRATPAPGPARGSARTSRRACEDSRAQAAPPAALAPALASHSHSHALAPCARYYGGGNLTKVNDANKPLTHEFVSLYLRGRTDGFVLKGGDATAGALATMYDGVRPDCAIAGTCQRHGNHTYQRVIGPDLICAAPLALPLTALAPLFCAGR